MVKYETIIVYSLAKGEEAAKEGIGDLQGLLAGVGLGNQHGVGVHAQCGGVDGVQSVLGIHEGNLAAHLLCLGQDVQGQGGLTGGLGAIDLDDTALGHAADAESGIQGQGAGGDGLHIHFGLVAQTHDRALAEALLDLGNGGVQCFFLVACRGGCLIGTGFLCHSGLLLYTILGDDRPLGSTKILDPLTDGKAVRREDITNIVALVLAEFIAEVAAGL